MFAVVTGASKGIGRAISLQLAEKGADLFLIARNREDLESCRAACLERRPGIRVWIHSADLSRKEEVSAAAAACKELSLPVDILVNNAGVFIPGAVHEEPDGILEKMIDTNLYSAYHLTRGLLPNMLARGSGHIFNICSTASIYAYPNGGSYSISKFALLGFSKVLREELKKKGIRVTAVLPGATWSASWQGVELPRERLMEAEDIARTIWGAYELSDNAVIEEILIRPQEGDLS